MTATRLPLEVGRLAPAVTRTARPQMVVASGQAAAGLGNLAFALFAARLLAPGPYADLVTFLALYLLLHLPAMSISAASALAPTAVRRTRRACAGIGVALGAAIAVGSGTLAGLLHLPTSMVLLVAAAAPGACLLGLERGRLYGTYRHGAIVATLVAEPLTRLSLGVVLATSIGAGGAAAAVVAGGYVALFAATRATAAGADGTSEAPTRQRVAAAITSFLLLAVLQNQDLLLAKALLADGQATRFAVISALGGAAAFATATIPLVLLPDASRRTRHAVTTAVGVAVALGAGVLAVGAVAPERLIVGLFGASYRDVATLVVPYLAAMALFGVARVLVAAWCTTRAGRATVALVAVVTVGHAAAIVTLARTPTDVVHLTLAATATLTAGLVAPALLRFPSAGRARSVLLSARAQWVVGLMVIALVLRLLVLRGIWIDEAISIRQAQLPWQEMLTELRFADVHPPLYQALLWLVVRTLGTGVLAVKLISIVAGVALVPALYATGTALYDRRTGLVAATLATFAPFLVWYSQEARMYALFILLAVLALYGQVQAIRRGRLLDWGIYALSTAGLLWTQYFAVLPLLVQQAAFVAAVWHRRGQRGEWRRVVLGWGACLLVIAACLAPLVPFVRGQVEAYANRSGNQFGELPAQAGSDVSDSGSGLSAYAAIANAIWAVWGYHADRVMAQIGALWPVGMLLALLALGRRRCRATTLVVALIVVPGVALFVLGLAKRDLFELRYFSGAVPMVLLVGARGITVAGPSRLGSWVLAGLATVTLSVALVDQQLNGANPRRYDFEGALSRVEAMATEDDVLLYEPNYLSAVVEYYAPDLDSRPLGRDTRTSGARRVFVLATDRVTGSKASSARVGDALARLEQRRDPFTDFRRPNVHVWVLQ